MTGPPAVRPTSNADGSARPLVEVRVDGVLLKRVAPGAAEQIVGRGWGEWIGVGRRRYVRLAESAPLSALRGWRGKDGTRQVRAEGTMTRAAGQRMGDSRSHREFIPLPPGA
jgi:hypothetical protein